MLPILFQNVAHGFGKRCPCFRKTLPVFFSNIADDFLFCCPWFWKTLGNVLERFLVLIKLTAFIYIYYVFSLSVFSPKI